MMDASEFEELAANVGLHKFSPTYALALFGLSIGRPVR
jgi:hypothetical protein